MAWSIDLGDVFYTFDPCSGCPESVTVPGSPIEPPSVTCPHEHLPNVPCAWDAKRDTVNAFIKKANVELAAILA